MLIISLPRSLRAGHVLGLVGSSSGTRRAYSSANTIASPTASPSASSNPEPDSLESYVSHLNENTSLLEGPSLIFNDPSEPPSHSERIPPSPGWAMRKHPELYEPPTLPPTHRIHVATLAIEAYNPDKEQLPLVTGFALQAAYHLGIPVTRPASMPIKTELHTVLRSGFVHKKSQENFWRLTHRRVIKAYDANEEVVNRWINYLRQEGVRGTNVGIKAQRFLYRQPGWGEDLERLARQEVELEQVEKPKVSKKKKKNAKIAVTASSPKLGTDPSAIDPTAFENFTDESATSQADAVKRLAEQLIEKELKPRSDALDKLLAETGTTTGKPLSELKLKDE